MIRVTYLHLIPSEALAIHRTPLHCVLNNLYYLDTDEFLSPQEGGNKSTENPIGSFYTRVHDVP